MDDPSLRWLRYSSSFSNQTEKFLPFIFGGLTLYPNRVHFRHKCLKKSATRTVLTAQVRGWMFKKEQNFFGRSMLCNALTPHPGPRWGKESALPLSSTPNRGP